MCGKKRLTHECSKLAEQYAEEQTRLSAQVERLGEQVRREFVARRGDGIEHDECWRPGGGEKLYRVGDRLQV